jgi:hypothetical protein
VSCPRTRECGAGLASLRDEHLTILAKIREQETQHNNTDDPLLEDRIAAVTEREEEFLFLYRNKIEAI